jgi:hypothetical protein
MIKLVGKEAARHTKKILEVMASREVKTEDDVVRELTCAVAEVIMDTVFPITDTANAILYLAVQIVTSSQSGAILQGKPGKYPRLYEPTRLPGEPDERVN